MLPELPEPPAIMPPPASWAAAGAVCVWLVSCSTVSVVSPTVPETPGHHPQPRVYRGSDADHIMPGVVWRQVAGAARCTGKRMCVGLGAASIVCPASCIWLRPFSRVMPAPTLRPLHHIVRMAGQMLDREGCAADSAGNTRPPPPTPRLPPLRCGSHTARRSTAAGCRRPQS